MIDVTFDCITKGRTEFPAEGEYCYFGHKVVITKKWKPDEKGRSVRYQGYFFTTSGDKVEIKRDKDCDGSRGTDLLAQINPDIRILKLNALYKEEKLTERNYMQFIP